MTELRVTRPCRRCRYEARCSGLVTSLRRAVSDHPEAADVEVVVDCRVYAASRRGGKLTVRRP